MQKPILLASKSPRRRELFAMVRENFECAESGVDESVITETDPEALCEALAKLKCLDVAAKHPDRVVVGCDTVVTLDGRILGKPHSREEAFEMLRSLSGREHRVVTGVYVYTPAREAGFAHSSTVRFLPLSDDDINAYIDTGDPFDKAGAYGIQNGASRFVDSVSGDYFSILGLPISRLHLLLRELGC